MILTKGKEIKRKERKWHAAGQRRRTSQNSWAAAGPSATVLPSCESVNKETGCACVTHTPPEKEHKDTLLTLSSLAVRPLSVNYTHANIHTHKYTETKPTENEATRRQNKTRFQRHTLHNTRHKHTHESAGMGMVESITTLCGDRLSSSLHPCTQV